MSSGSERPRPGAGLWVGLALLFGAVVFAILGTTAGTKHTTAWLLESSLSVDNLFVFAVIFAYFKFPAHTSAVCSSSASSAPDNRTFLKGRGWYAQSASSVWTWSLRDGTRR